MLRFLFTSSGYISFDNLLSSVDQVVSPDMNALLLRTIIDEEIKTAAFQLGSL